VVGLDAKCRQDHIRFGTPHLVANQQIDTAVLNSKGQELVLTHVCYVGQLGLLVIPSQQFVLRHLCVGLVLVIRGKLFRLLLKLLKKRLLFLRLNKTEIHHVLAHPVVILDNFLVDHGFGELGLLQHFFEHLVLFPQHTNQLIDIALVNDGPVFYLFGPTGVSQS
jgi:hypothetical protein